VCQVGNGFGNKKRCGFLVGSWFGLRDGGYVRLNLIFAVCHMHNMFGGSGLKLVTVLLPEAYLEGLDELVRANMYPSRSSAIRSSVRDLLKKELWERRNR
jgi:antitoxin ParD1/3/4